MLLVAALWTFAVRPGETIGCLFTLGLLGLMNQYPMVGLPTLAILALAGMIATPKNDR